MHGTIISLIALGYLIIETIYFQFNIGRQSCSEEMICDGIACLMICMGWMANSKK